MTIIRTQAQYSGVCFSCIGTWLACQGGPNVDIPSLFKDSTLPTVSKCRGPDIQWSFPKRGKSPFIRSSLFLSILHLVDCLFHMDFCMAWHGSSDVWLLTISSSVYIAVNNINKRKLKDVLCHYTLTICPDHTMGCGCRQTNLVKPYATPGIVIEPEWSIRVHILKPRWRHGLRQSDRSTNNGLKY